ncbi:NADPH-dependent diflavin oxidoreductase 1 [Lactobacillus phage CV244]|nr:NADPH-dependent diflavin oxidoreductase 1 [Lactobacillus phage CV244]
MSILLVDYRGEFPKEPVSISEGVADDVDEALLQRLGWIFNRVSMLISGLECRRYSARQEKWKNHLLVDSLKH